MNMFFHLLFLFVFLIQQDFCIAKPDAKLNNNKISNAQKDKNLPLNPNDIPDRDLHISSDSMDYDGNTNIANAVGTAHAFRYVEKDGGVYKQTIDAKRFEAHFVPQQKTPTKSAPAAKSASAASGDNPNIDIIKAFDDVVIETASQTIWADVCTFEVQKDHIDCEKNVRIKDKKTNNEVFGERAKVNLKTEKYVMERGKKQTRARIVSNQGTSSSSSTKPKAPKKSTDSDQAA